MPTSDKNILITPNIGQNAEPNIRFVGASANVGPQVITAFVYPESNGTISFEGSAGQLFSITNDLTGIIFSVNDISGVPSIEVANTGLVELAPFAGNVIIGKTTDTNDGRLQVLGTTTSNIFRSTALTGTAPLVINSTTLVANLNAQLLNGNNQAFFTNASSLVTGTVAPARLGSGTANSTTFLRGDNTWAGGIGDPGATGATGPAGATGARGPAGKFLRYTSLIGNGTSNTITVNHNLNSANIFINVKETANGYYVYPDIKYSNTNTFVLEFVDAPSSNEYTVLVVSFIDDYTYYTTIGDGTSTTFTVTHNLNSQDIFVNVKEVTSGYFVYPTIQYSNTSSINVSFAYAPTSNQYGVLIFGF